MSESSGNFSCIRNGTNPNSPLSIPSILPANHSDSESDSIPGSNETYPKFSHNSNSIVSFFPPDRSPPDRSPTETYPKFSHNSNSIVSFFPPDRSPPDRSPTETYPKFSHNSNSTVSFFPPARSPTDSTENYKIIITNPSITKTSSFSHFFPPFMSEIEIDGSCSESSQSSRAQFSNSILSLLHSVTIKLAAMNADVFESRKLAFQQIMEALHDDNSKRIGLHGIGGVGKTTLVKEVYKKVEELNIFKDIVMIVVSQTPDVRKIQGEIADCLQLQLEEESNTARANRICLRIKSVEKILIILDDVWKDVNLEAIGIPSCDDHRGCKMLLTTRSVHICNLMRCQRKIYQNSSEDDHKEARAEDETAELNLSEEQSAA